VIANLREGLARRPAYHHIDIAGGVKYGRPDLRFPDIANNSLSSAEVCPIRGRRVGVVVCARFYREPRLSEAFRQTASAREQIYY
jgi:hypothetical protein